MDESRYRQNECGEHEWRCTRCNSWCIVELDPGHPAYSGSWCDECNDYPGGFLAGVPCPATEIGQALWGM